MKPRFLPVFAVALGLSTIGCDYSSDEGPLASPRSNRGPLPSSGLATNSTNPAPGKISTSAVSSYVSAEQKERQEKILENVVNLIQTASIRPGGDNFRIATENLNQYFENGVDPAEYFMGPGARQMFRDLRIPDQGIRTLESRRFELPDARHIEDCMMYNMIAIRVAGEGDQLTRARRIFDWIVRQVQLVPPQSLMSITIDGKTLPQVPVRPYDALLRGMATETDGYWSERGWLFMALCRQIGIDVGLLTFTPPRGGPLLQGDAEPAETSAVAWIFAAIIDKKAYLFDPTIGLEIPGPDGQGVATLEEAMTDPIVLDRLNLPGRARYGATRGDLLASKTKIGVLLDSSSGYLSPKMRLLQRRLVGKNRSVLFADPSEQRARITEAVGSRLGVVGFWSLPQTVETEIFRNPAFTEATLNSIRLFDPRLPLLYARIAQLRGELTQATQDMVSFRFAVNGVMRDKEKTPIPPEIQTALDAYSTYFLAQCHLEQGNKDRAEFFYRKTLELLPEFAPGRPYYWMYRWGAQTNLGKLLEEKGDFAGASQYYAAADPTTQHFGNLLRAREIIWRNPLGPVAAPLPPPPPAPGSPASLAPAPVAGPAGAGSPGITVPPILLGPNAAPPPGGRPN